MALLIPPVFEKNRVAQPVSVCQQQRRAACQCLTAATWRGLSVLDKRRRVGLSVLDRSGVA